MYTKEIMCSIAGLENSKESITTSSFLEKTIVLYAHCSSEITAFEPVLADLTGDFVLLIGS